MRCLQMRPWIKGRYGQQGLSGGVDSAQLDLEETAPGSQSQGLGVIPPIQMGSSRHPEHLQVGQPDPLFSRSSLFLPLHLECHKSLYLEASTSQAQADLHPAARPVYLKPLHAETRALLGLAGSQMHFLSP